MPTDLSTIPLVFVVQSIFLAVLTKKATRSSSAISLILLSLCLWGGVSFSLAVVGAYDSEIFLSLLPGFWLPAVPIGIVGVLLGLPPVRSAVIQIALLTPPHWFVAIQALRVTALGTLIKTIQGEFPLHVEIAVGLNDIVYGLSAVLLYPLARQGQLSAYALMIWHWVGFLLVVVPGEIAIQTGLPGPLQIFDDPPTAEKMLDLWMVLAPSLVVPIFLMLNLLAIFSAHRQAREEIDS